MKSRSIFLERAIEERRWSWLGSPRITQPLPTRFALLVLFAFSASVVLLMSLGTYSRTAAIHGRMELAEEVAVVRAPTDGTLRVDDVELGKAVAEDRILFSVAGEAANANDRAPVPVDASLLEIDLNHAIERIGRDDRMVHARQLLFMDEKRIVEQAIERFDVAVSTTRERIRSWRNGGAGIPSSPGSARIHLADCRSATGRAEVVPDCRHLDWLMSERARWEAELHRLRRRHDEFLDRFDSRRLQLARRIAETRLRLARSDRVPTVDVSAGVTGSVRAIEKRDGERVSEGDIVLEIVSKSGSTHATFEVGADVATALRIGDLVHLRHERVPSGSEVQEIGQVIRIEPNEPNATTDRGDASNHDGDATYSIDVSPTGSLTAREAANSALRPGMSVTATVEVETRRAYQWLFGGALR